jgi:hypothetical protein
VNLTPFVLCPLSLEEHVPIDHGGKMVTQFPRPHASNLLISHAHFYLDPDGEIVPRLLLRGHVLGSM